MSSEGPGIRDQGTGVKRPGLGVAQGWLTLFRFSLGSLVAELEKTLISVDRREPAASKAGRKQFWSLVPQE